MSTGKPRFEESLVDGVCPTCGATTDLDTELLYSINRVLEWKRQTPADAVMGFGADPSVKVHDVFDGAIEDMRAAALEATKEEG